MLWVRQCAEDVPSVAVVQEILVEPQFGHVFGVDVVQVLWVAVAGHHLGRQQHNIAILCMQKMSFPHKRRTPGGFHEGNARNSVQVRSRHMSQGRDEKWVQNESVGSEKH